MKYHPDAKINMCLSEKNSRKSAKIFLFLVSSNCIDNKNLFFGAILVVFGQIYYVVETPK